MEEPQPAKRRKFIRTKRISVAVISVAVTVFLTILILNLRSGEKVIRYEMDHRFTVEDPQFIRTMGNLLGPAVIDGNKITALQNGDQIFPAMLDAIRGAQKSITFETYIYWSGAIGEQFSKALCERARAGVKVHVILDWVGTGQIDSAYLDELEESGVQFERYHPIRWYTLTRINNRTHRKLLIVDGKMGFTGGVGIADLWTGNAQSKDHWRDSHYKIEGPAVAQMQAAFNDNWIKTKAVVLFGPDYFPKLEPVGTALAQVFHSSKGEGSASVRLMYLLSIASAGQSIKLQSAYFVPDDLAIDTFVAAAKRGVNIEIIVPGPFTDAKIVQAASRARWGELLDHGVKIFEYQPTMYHCKVIIVDNLWVSVGSTNFDDRSFRLNDEANLNIYDREFATQQAAVFDEDRSKARLINRNEFKKRSLFQKTYENATALIRRQL